MNNSVSKKYNFQNKCAIVTGGAGVLGSCFTKALLESGVNVALLDLNADKTGDFSRYGHRFLPIKTDVLQKNSVQTAVDKTIEKFGTVDFLINAAGGNHPKASSSKDMTFFDLPPDALKFVIDLNLLGTVLPSQVVGRIMADRQQGVIVNISSMSAFRPLTRVVGYSAAKAAVTNFTQWLAVYMAQDYSPKIRVNAMAPGFFLTKQNEFLLIDKETGKLTERGQKIIDHTPLGRFGDPEDLLGALFWLLSEDAQFVTGIVLPIDGGFSAYSGV